MNYLLAKESAKECVASDYQQSTCEEFSTNNPERLALFRVVPEIT
jgi:hypothetical protein